VLLFLLLLLLALVLLHQVRHCLVGDPVGQKLHDVAPEDLLLAVVAAVAAAVVAPPASKHATGILMRIVHCQTVKLHHHAVK
jgi:hypothetical protein